MESRIKKMLEAGVHFGHQKSRWNPKMDTFIFTERGNVHIFDLVRTDEQLTYAEKFIEKIVEEKGIILFVGTKKQAQAIIKEAAESCDMPYVTERWLGGMLTNFDTFLKRIKTLKAIQEQVDKKAFATKKQLLVASKKANKISENLGGISNLEKKPDAVFVVDVIKENTAIKEAKKLNIPIVAIVDTNGNPSKIDYVIPGNDDALKSIQFFAFEIADVINRAKLRIKDDKENNNVS